MLDHPAVRPGFAVSQPPSEQHLERVRAQPHVPGVKGTFSRHKQLPMSHRYSTRYYQSLQMQHRCFLSTPQDCGQKLGSWAELAGKQLVGQWWGPGRWFPVIEHAHGRQSLRYEPRLVQSQQRCIGPDTRAAGALASEQSLVGEDAQRLPEGG